MVMWYTTFDFWCTAIVLAVCAGYLCLAPSWWRGSWSASPIHWRDRAWLATVTGVTLLAVATIFMKILESYDSDVTWMWAVGMSVLFAGLLTLALAPVVGWWSALDFAVPRRLRTGARTLEQRFESKTLIHGNRSERRAKRRRRG
jgi:hypothetical protein